METQRLRELLSKFEKTRVLVIGDIFLDENVYGSVTEVSLEAPIPILVVQDRRYNPGAAGNAACNVAALGAKTFMLGVIGSDINGEIVKREFAARKVDTAFLVVDPARPTNTYGKLRAGGFNTPEQEVLRTDTPRPPLLSGKVEDAVIENIRKLASQVDAIVVVDQVSSVATERVLTAVVDEAKKHKLLTVGDSRSRAGKFKGFDIVVPNDREAGIGVGIDVTDDNSLHAAAKELLKLAQCAMITCGPKGITIFDEKGGVVNVPVRVSSRDVQDVTGAGDTVTAAVTVTLLAGGTREEAAYIGNAAAGIAVTKKGVVTVPKSELEHSLFSQAESSKIKSLDELQAVVSDAQKHGKRVVWTNGCFDIIHAGHIRYLEKAAGVGDVLVVGLNSDASVKAVKGPTRPIVPEHERAIVLSALECVDYVTVFSEPAPLPLLKVLKPDVYVKGGDYTIDTIVQEERRLVEGYGGKIEIISGVEGLSTTRIIDRIATKDS
jgi:D-beta-D-heptose 7-phosphate kinase/D-beta-D-heptose 1-phosphate adenosyltransferase